MKIVLLIRVQKIEIINIWWWNTFDKFFFKKKTKEKVKDWKCSKRNTNEVWNTHTSTDYPLGTFLNPKWKSLHSRKIHSKLVLFHTLFPSMKKKKKKWKIRKSVCHGVISRPVGMEFLFPKRSGWFPNIIVCKIFILKQFQIKLLSWWSHWKI